MVLPAHAGFERHAHRGRLALGLDLRLGQRGLSEQAREHAQPLGALGVLREPRPEGLGGVRLHPLHVAGLERVEQGPRDGAGRRRRGGRRAFGLVDGRRAEVGEAHGMRAVARLHRLDVAHGRGRGVPPVGGSARRRPAPARPSRRRTRARRAS